MKIISLILFSLGMAFNAISDTLAHHFSTSVFRNLDPQWWNPDISWINKTTMFTQTSDAWHLSKTLMLISFIFSIIFYKPLTKIKSPLLSKAVDFLIIGVTGIIVFNIFYDWIL